MLLDEKADAPARPGLRVEVTAGGRLLLRQGGRVVLLGRQRAQHRGVHYWRTGNYVSPFPPIRAEESRRVRAERWIHQFAAWLRVAGDGPLHAGAWTLAWGAPTWMAPELWPRLPRADADQGHITWYGYGDPGDDQRDILPLRALSPAGAGRVKAYRRQYREGILPPVLLWWVSGLDTLLLLDGHDRLVAALAEEAVPDVVVLSPAADPERVAAWTALRIRAYDGRIAHLESRTGLTHPPELTALGRRLAGEIAEAERTLGRTRAWPLPGGPAAWERYRRPLTVTGSPRAISSGRPRSPR